MDFSQWLHQGFIWVGNLLAVIIIVLFFLFAILMVGGGCCLWIARMMGFRGEGRSRIAAGFIFSGPLLLVLFLWFVAWWQSPTNLSRGDVIGVYEINRSFYAGAQAEWQHETYEVEITSDECILQDTRTETVWRYPIEWGWGGRWRFEDTQLRHHLLRSGPTLYRRNFTHYYVFKSPHYGNVFFSRRAIFPVWVTWGLALLFLILALWWCFRKRGWESF